MKTKTLNRNFILLIIGQASSMFGTVLLKFTVSLLILDLTRSAALFGTITAISYLPPIFLSPIGGIMADRNDKRNLMIALDSLYGIMAILLVLSLSFSNVLVLITVIMVGLSIVSSFETPVVQSSIPLIQKKESLIQSNAIVRDPGDRRHWHPWLCDAGHQQLGADCVQQPAAGLWRRPVCGHYDRALFRAGGPFSAGHGHHRWRGAGAGL